MKHAFLTALLTSSAIPAYAADITVQPLADRQTVIHIDGRIERDNFEAFKWKANPLTGMVAVHLRSPGGNLIAALQIGEYIRLKGWATAVLSECDSACAALWLAGSPRVLIGRTAKVGFHAASINGQEKGSGNALVGAYMNKLGLGYGAVLWATSASPSEIEYLTPAKAREFGIAVLVLEPDGRQTDYATVKPVAPPAPRPVPQPATPAPKQTSLTETQAAIRFLTKAITDPDTNAENHRRYYSSYVLINGALKSQDEEISQLQADRNKWPDRTWKITSMGGTCRQEDCITAICRIVTCWINGQASFQAESPYQTAFGTGALEYTLRGIAAVKGNGVEWGNASFFITSAKTTSIKITNK